VVNEMFPNTCLKARSAPVELAKAATGLLKARSAPVELAKAPTALLKARSAPVELAKASTGMGLFFGTAVALVEAFLEMAALALGQGCGGTLTVLPCCGTGDTTVQDDASSSLGS